MKSFGEFAIEQVFEELAGQLGQAFVGGALQRANNQSFNPLAAVNNPYQQQRYQYQPSQNQYGYQPQQKTYQKFLTSQQQKVNALQNWFNQKPSPINAGIVGSNYQGNVNQLKNDLNYAMRSWLQDDRQTPTSWDTYLKQYFHHYQ